MAWAEVTQDTLVYQYDYGFDMMGNVVDTQENVVGSPLRTVAMGYDNVYRLISETIVDDGTTTLTTFGYDLNNNRLGKSVAVNGGTAENTTYVLDTLGLNQVVQVQLPDSSTVGFTYDDNGNRITKTDADGTDTYTYDYENRLIALDDTVTGSAVESYAYTYDYRTRRVIRDESAAASGVITSLVFSAGLSVQEYDDEIPAATTEDPDVEYIRGSDWGGGIGGVLYTFRQGAPSYNHYNNRGDVIAKTDATGSLTYQAGYEAFGTRTREDGSTEDRQKANTKDEDPWGALNEGMRYRDLEFGVWLTRDPAGFVDGPNLYGYVKQNPWSAFDPFGLDCVIVSGGIHEDPNSTDTHDSNWRNFVDSARTELYYQRRQLEKGENLEWHVQRSSYIERAKYDGKPEDEYIEEIERIAKEMKAELRFYETAKDLADNLNETETGALRTKERRVSHLQIFGHGIPGQFWTEYGGSEKITNSDLDSGVFQRSSFAPAAFGTNWCCNAGQPPHGDPRAWIDALFDNTGVAMIGAVGRVDYTPIGRGTKK